MLSPTSLIAFSRLCVGIVTSVRWSDRTASICMGCIGAFYMGISSASCYVKGYP